MVVAMGCSSALCVSVPVAVAVNSSNFAPLPSLDSIHGGNGLGSAFPMVRKCGALQSVVANKSRQWRRESSLGILRNVRVRASSSGDSPGDKGPAKTEDVPSWAKPDSAELPPWAKNERSASQEPVQEVPFAVYLIGSSLVAIAAVGSVFELYNRNPIFGVVDPDSPLYIPILGFFAITGLPSAGFLFYKSIMLANKASEEADREDGYRR